MVCPYAPASVIIAIVFHDVLIDIVRRLIKKNDGLESLSKPLQKKLDALNRLRDPFLVLLGTP